MLQIERPRSNIVYIIFMSDSKRIRAKLKEMPTLKGILTGGVQKMDWQNAKKAISDVSLDEIITVDLIN